MTRTIRRLHVSMLSPCDVIPSLGRGRAHWKPGFSAHALATTWFAANGFPTAVAETLATCPTFADCDLIDAFLERQIDLRDGFRPSQTDLLAIVGCGRGLATIAVEGKVEEPFGPTVEKWRDGSDNKRVRLDGLRRALNLERLNIEGVRYQLLHRAASAIYEAQRYRATAALLLVHSFSPARTGFADFAAFLHLLGFPSVQADRIVGPIALEGIAFYAGWVADDLASVGPHP